jgi:hypothetical protein
MDQQPVRDATSEFGVLTHPGFIGVQRIEVAG